MPDILVYAIPGFVILIVLEFLILKHQHQRQIRPLDFTTSISMGIGKLLVDNLIAKALIFGFYSWCYSYHLFELSARSVVVWVALFFADDFTYYWYHRSSHTIRYFWASHVIHHSSQEYYLSTALRQTWTGSLSGTFLFWAWLPLLGFQPIMVITMQSISLIYQFWIHTRAIKKLPYWFETVFNTPSHHRVHHATNLEYLDKNHAGVLIVWDRLFGTFQPEVEEPIYGLTTNIKTNNPLKVATHEWQAIFSDIFTKAQNLQHFFFYLFGPPGWSHDGSRKTTKQLRKENQTAKNKNLV
jgi:sterol desaturase/sphingolipid hydroxylase (fatty acid hydroxylase superfamily)